MGHLRFQQRGVFIDRASITAYLKKYCPACGKIARIHQASDRRCAVEDLPEPCENGDPAQCITEQFQPLEHLGRGEVVDTRLSTASPGPVLFARTEEGTFRFVIQTPHMPGAPGDQLIERPCSPVPVEDIIAESAS